MKHKFTIGLLIILLLFQNLKGQTLVNNTSGTSRLNYHSDFEKNIFTKYKSGKITPISSIYLMSDERVTAQENAKINAGLLHYIDYLKNKQVKFEEEKFLKFLFYKTHRKYLKFYSEHSTLNQTFTKGLYDCLSGTSLYVLILDELGFQYEIHETDYHIYLVVHSHKQKRYLLECTDPSNGFVSDENEIVKRQQYYNSTKSLAESNSSSGISSKTPADQHSKEVNNTVNKLELAGLHYYNKAIDLYNHHTITTAFHDLQKGILFYNSQRLKDLLYMVVNVGLTGNDLSIDEKSKLKEEYLDWLEESPSIPFIVTFNQTAPQ